MPRQSRLGLGAKPLSHEEMKKLGKRPQPNSDQTEDKSALKVGCLVQIIDGTHSGKEAKIIGIEKQAKTDLISNLTNTNSEDPNQYITIELVQSKAILQIKRKRLIKKEIYDKLNGKQAEQ